MASTYQRRAVVGDSMGSWDLMITVLTTLFLGPAISPDGTQDCVRDASIYWEVVALHSQTLTAGTHGAAGAARSVPSL
jgi:hypothetical protein